MAADTPPFGQAEGARELLRRFALDPARLGEALRIQRHGSAMVDRTLSMAENDVLDGLCGRSLGEICAARGWLGPAAVAEFDAAWLAWQGNQPTQLRPDPGVESATTSAGRNLLQTRVPGDEGSPDSAASLPRPFGRYTILKCLGAGGMGVVWQAFDPELKRTVALKEIRAGGSESQDLLDRFTREARIAARLRHPNIVGVHDVGEVDGRRYLTMDFVEGRTLAQRIDEGREARRQGRPFVLASLRDDVRILADVAQAVAYAHGEAVTHRDLKPGNIIVDPEGTPHVIDFGLAKESRPGVDLSTAHAQTLSGAVLGTPAYMSPEQAAGRPSAIGPMTDVYALGAILYEMLTGRPPFEADGAGAMLLAILTQDPARPKWRNRHVPTDLEAICLKALEKEPQRRYPSAKYFELELRRWLAGDPVEAARQGAVYRWLRRHPVAIGVAVVLWILILNYGPGEADSTAKMPLHRLATAAIEASSLARRSGSGQGVMQRRILPAFEEGIANLHREAPDEPLANLDFGSMLRVLQRFDAARVHADSALVLHGNHRPSYYLRLVLRTTRHLRRLGTLQELWIADQLVRDGREELPDGERLVRADLEWTRGANGVREDSWGAWGRGHRRPLLDDMETVPPAAADCVEALALLFTQGRIQDRVLARGLLERSLASEPGFVDALEALALLEALGSDARAEATLARGIAADAGYAPFRLARGDLRLRQCWSRRIRGEAFGPEAAAAREDFERAQVLCPELVECAQRRGLLQYLEGNWAEAAVLLTPAAARDPEGGARLAALAERARARAAAAGS